LKNFLFYALSKLNDLSETEEEVDKEEIIKANLILNAEWKNLDIMFATTKMTKFIILRKELYDPLDINPEIIIIDDFDYIIEYINLIIFNKKASI